jgi:hypothetical protein
VLFGDISDLIDGYYTHAYPGIYQHSVVKLKNNTWFNLIHHKKRDGEKIGVYLCSVSGYSEHVEDNVWTRYDWCDYIN